MKNQLCERTLKRIAIGRDKYWNNPFVMYGGDQKLADRTYSIAAAIPTQCSQPWYQIISPFIGYSSNNHGTNFRTSDGKDPLNTQTTTQDASVVSPPVPFILGNFLSRTLTEIKDPIKAQACSVHDAVIYPPFVMQSAYDGSDQPINKALMCQTTHQNLELIQLPFLTELNNLSTVRSTIEAINTQTTRVKNGLVTTEAIQAFIGHYYGNAYETHITEALGACTTKERHYMASWPAGKKIEVEDCYYRMIRSKEVKRAMDWGDNYIVLGNEREVVQQCGNGVTPKVAKWLFTQCLNSIL